MIRHDIQNQAHVAPLQLGAERDEVVPGSKGRTEARGIDDVVPAGGIGVRLKDGRSVDVA